MSAFCSDAYAAKPDHVNRPSAAHAVNSSPGRRPTSGTTTCNTGQHVALAAPQHRLGHPRPPGLRLGDAWPDEIQPGEERLDVGARMVVPGGGGVLRRQPLAERLVVIARHRDDQAASRRHQPRVSGGHRPGGIGVQEVQDRAEDDPGRRRRVDDGPQIRMRQDAGRVTQVRRDTVRPELVPLCCPAPS